MKLQSMTMKTLCVAVSLALAGCGGGGGGSSNSADSSGTDSNGSGSGTTTSAAPVVEVSANELTVLAGESVNFDISASDDEGLTSFNMSCENGLSLSLSNILSGTPTTFETTPTITAANYATDTASQCEVTFGDADNNSETVEISVNITGVNLAPEVTVSDDTEVNLGQQVFMLAEATDPNVDGGIATYQWVQTAGTEVELSGANTNNANFTAPEIPYDEVLIFEVTVTDIHGAETKESVNVSVFGVASANVDVLFPIDGGTTVLAEGEELVVFGNAVTAIGTQLETVTLTHGANTVNIPVADDGSWRGTIALEAGEQLEINISATNSLGFEYQDTLNLNRSIDFSGESVFTKSNSGVVGAALHSEANTLYIQTQGDTIGTTQLLEYDIIEQDISQVELTDVDVNTIDLIQSTRDIELDKENNVMYVANSRSIFAIDLSNNERTQVHSGFFGISDIDLDPANNLIYVADNSFGALGKLDLTTGEDEYFEASSNYSAIVSVDYLESDNSIIVSAASANNSPFSRVDLDEQTPSPDFVGSADTESVENLTFELAVTSDGSKAYFVDASTSLKVIEFATQTVQRLQNAVAVVSGSPTSQSAIELDEEKGLLYIVAEDPSGEGNYTLVVVDLVSNEMIKKPI